jgi:hypothetical protein
MCNKDSVVFIPLQEDEAYQKYFAASLANIPSFGYYSSDNFSKCPGLGITICTDNRYKNM